MGVSATRARGQPWRFGLALLLLGAGGWWWGGRLVRGPSPVAAMQVSPARSPSRLRPLTARRSPGHVGDEPAAESGPAARAREEVASKLASFAADRRSLVHRIAQSFGLPPPPGTEEFFAAVAASRWQEVDMRAAALLRAAADDDASDALRSALAPVFETYCVIDAAQSRPPEELLAEGRALLASVGSAQACLCPDPSQYGILSLLNATAGEGRKIVISPPLLADPAYAAYLRFLYPTQLAALSAQDLLRARQACAMRAPSAAAAADEVPAELARTLMRMNPRLTFAGWGGDAARPEASLLSPK